MRDPNGIAWNPARDNDDPGMGSARSEGVTGELDEVVTVVGDDDPPVSCRRSEMLGVRAWYRTRVGSTYDVKPQAARNHGGSRRDIFIEVESKRPRRHADDGDDGAADCESDGAEGCVKGSSRARRSGVHAASRARRASISAG